MRRHFRGYQTLLSRASRMSTSKTTTTPLATLESRPVEFSNFFSVFFTRLFPNFPIPKGLPDIQGIKQEIPFLYLMLIQSHHAQLRFFLP